MASKNPNELGKGSKPKSFRTNPASEVALRHIMDFMESEGSKPSVSDLVNDLIREKFEQLKQASKLPSSAVDPYELVDLIADIKSKKIPLLGHHTPSGRKKTVDQLSVVDFNELINEGLLEDPKELAKANGAFAVREYLDFSDQLTVYEYQTPLGKFKKTLLGKGDHKWEFEPASPVAENPADDPELTEEYVAESEEIEVEGNSGFYLTKCQHPSGRVFWKRGAGQMIGEIVLTKRDGEPPPAGGDADETTEAVFQIKDGMVQGFLQMVQAMCVPREREILEYAFDDSKPSMADVQQHFGISATYCQEVLFGCIRRIRFVNLRLQLDPTRKTKASVKDLDYYTEVNNKASYETTKYLARWIKEIAVELVRGEAGNTAMTLKEEVEGEDGGHHKVYEFNPESLVGFFKNPSVKQKGILGLWEIHVHRGPFDSSSTYTVRPSDEPLPQANTSYEVAIYDNAGREGGYWVEVEKAGGRYVAMLWRSVGDGNSDDVISYRQFDYSYVDGLKRIREQFNSVQAQLRKEYGRNPKLREMAYEMGTDVFELSGWMRRFLTSDNRYRAYHRLRINRSRWASDYTVDFEDDFFTKINWNDKKSEDRPTAVEDAELGMVDIVDNDLKSHLLPKPLRVAKASFVRAYEQKDGLVIGRFRFSEKPESGTQYIDVYPIQSHRLGMLTAKLEHFTDLSMVLDGQKEVDVAAAVDNAAQLALTPYNPGWVIFEQSAVAESFQSTTSRNVLEFAKQITKHKRTLSALPDQGVTREQVQKVCNKPHIPAESCVLMILAWLNLRTDNATALWSQRKYWLPLITEMRNNSVEGLEAYRRFKELRKLDRLPGIRPSTYTAFIHFFLGSDDWSVMTQWASRSINEISRLEIVNLTEKGHVDDTNEVWNYDAFCKYVARIGKQTNLSRTQVEDAMRGKVFQTSESGDSVLVETEWRKHLEAEWTASSE